MSKFDSVAFKRCIVDKQDLSIDPNSPDAENYRWASIPTLKRFIKERATKMSCAGSKTVLMERLARDSAEQMNRTRIINWFQEQFKYDPVIKVEYDQYTNLNLYKFNFADTDYLVDPLTSIMYSYHTHEKICRYNPLINQLHSI